MSGDMHLKVKNDKHYFNSNLTMGPSQTQKHSYSNTRKYSDTYNTHTIYTNIGSWTSNDTQIDATILGCLLC